MRIGILAVQGAFEEHKNILSKMGADIVLLRSSADIHDLDGLVLPGGESTVQGKLLKELNMFSPLKELISGGIPVLATCAGLILLAENISNDENAYFQTLPVTVRRNAYGRQLGSFRCTSGFGGIRDFEMTFIRAPYIEAVSEDVKIMSVVDSHIVGVCYEKQIGLSFHPELGGDTRIHEAFLNMI